VTWEDDVAITNGSLRICDDGIVLDDIIARDDAIFLDDVCA
jgi:hypothetical protein